MGYQEVIAELGGTWEKESSSESMEGQKISGGY